MIRTGVTPEVNALSAVFLLASVLVITLAFLVTQHVNARSHKASPAAWCRSQQLPVAFALAGGYIGEKLDQSGLVALHRLTLAAAAASASAGGAQ